LVLLKAASETQTTSQEMIAQFMKKTDELQLSTRLGELKMEIREKDLKLRELERDCKVKEKELELELERARECLQLKDKEMIYKSMQWDKERKAISEQGAVSKRLLQTLQRE
jgi:hypothetical protein